MSDVDDLIRYLSREAPEIIEQMLRVDGTCLSIGLIVSAVLATALIAGIVLLAKSNRCDRGIEMAICGCLLLLVLAIAIPVGTEYYKLKCFPALYVLEKLTR